MKKKTALRLVAALLALLFTPIGQVFAKGESITLTVMNEKEGHQYFAVQILKGDLDSTQTILTNLEWGAAVAGNEEAFLKDIQKIAGFENVKTPQDLAQALTEDKGRIEAFSKAMYGHKVNGIQFTRDEESKTYQAKVSPGYYMIIDEEGSLDGKLDESYTSPIIKVTSDETIVPKSAIPSLEKKVLEESYASSDQEASRYGDKYNDVADYHIGDEIAFRLYATLPDNLTAYKTYEMTFEDSAQSGLTFKRIDSVDVVKDGEVLFSLTEGEYALEEKDAQHFDLKIEDVIGCFREHEKALDSGATIRVTYTMSLNENAVTGLPGQKNTAKLLYSNNPNAQGTGETKEDFVVVFTYGLDAIKVDGKDDHPLEGAQFVLKMGDLFAKIEEGKICGWTSNEKEAGVLSSGEDGTFGVLGLDAGVYDLIETKAPDGYNLLKEPVRFTVTAQTENGQDWAGEDNTGLKALTIEVGGKSESGDIEAGLVSLSVQNNKGWTLPETGLSGKRAFLVAGALIAAAGVTLYLRQCRAK